MDDLRSYDRGCRELGILSRVATMTKPTSAQARLSFPALRISVLVCAVACTFACAFSIPDIPTVPANPTYAADVRPLLAQQCLLCHGYPARRGAPSDFRLDVYADTDGVRGAYSEASRFVHAVTSDSMPPAAAWGDGVGPNGKQLLQNWLADGAPP